MFPAIVLLNKLTESPRLESLRLLAEVTKTCFTLNNKEKTPKMNSKVPQETEEAQENYFPGGNHNPFKTQSRYRINHKKTKLYVPLRVDFYAVRYIGGYFIYIIEVGPKKE